MVERGPSSDGCTDGVELIMSEERVRSPAARAIKAFVEHPVTKLLKGLALLLIGLSEASHTIREDIAHFHVRVGHGLILIGLFSILEALPHLIDGLEAALNFADRPGKPGAPQR
jgi:hypothetical protein